MDRNIDYQGTYGPSGPGFDPTFENDIYKDPMFNPMLQYEQAYMYYRYLTQQIEYKIKCKEYDRMCANNSKIDNRRIE